MVWDKQCLEDSELKDDRLSQRINDKGDCRTALATPDLFMTQVKRLDALNATTASKQKN